MSPATATARVEILPEPLARHPHLIPELARMMHHEWQDFAPWAEPAAIEARLCLAASAAALPFALVAVKDAQAVGTASIKLHELPGHADKAHWMSEVFIHPQQRGHGIGSVLIRACMAHARRLALPALYLYTPDQQALYRRFGWQDLQQEQVNGEMVSIMVWRCGAGQ
jgi:predicted N-acetyltransferase YhbS